ncbi:hypothetical protein [Cysteiniphilum sp. 6C5]|uniref:hypothetical protein n=1 Tax=unclassified Cysteiniphilum TaxID=2610889 RepID=UPI003F85119D
MTKTKELNIGQLGSSNHPKIVAVNALYNELNAERQAQVDRYAACLQTQDFSAGITGETKIKLLANEVFNGIEECFESRLQGLSKIYSEDDAYAYMNKAYQQKPRLLLEHGDRIDSAGAKPSMSIQDYLNNDKGYGCDK